MMLKNKTLCIVILFIIFISASCNKNNFDDPSNFDYIIRDGNVVITRYIGDNPNVVIPPKIENKQVTEIGVSAFRRFDLLESVIIPNGVTVIGASAFAMSTLLENVIMPNTITTIGMEAFGCCSSLKSITIPDGVTVIEERTFALCGFLVDIKIPDSVTTIGMNAFARCYSLSEESKQRILEIDPNIVFYTYYADGSLY